MSAIAVATTTYTCWFEVKPKSGGQWRRYDLLVPDSECLGDFTTEFWFGSPLDFATEQLHYYLPSIVGDVEADEDLPELLVRVRAWPDEDTSGDPVALVQATDDEMEEARLEHACRSVAGAERQMRDAREKLDWQILRSRDAGLSPRALAQAVRGRVDAEALDRLLEAHALARRVRTALARLDEHRAYANVADCDRGTVGVGLHLTPAEEVCRETMRWGMDYVEAKSPETLKQAEAFHFAALRDAQAVLDTLADRYYVRIHEGDPVCAASLAPQPLCFAVSWYVTGLSCRSDVATTVHSQLDQIGSLRLPPPGRPARTGPPRSSTRRHSTPVRSSPAASRRPDPSATVPALGCRRPLWSGQPYG